MTISIDKQYRTRDGREVRIYAVDGAEPNSVHGALWADGEWHCTCWTQVGSVFNSGKDASYQSDLIEVKPRIYREYWVNIYETELSWGVSRSREMADKCAKSGRIACVKVVIDCEEGEGL